MSVVEAGGAEVHHTWDIHDLLKYTPGKLRLMQGPVNIQYLAGHPK